MNDTRTAILDWMAQGRLRPHEAAHALRLAGMIPGGDDWRSFLDRLMLWIGTVSCGAAVVFFFAYNWQDMGRFAKFGLVELLLLVSLASSWRLSLDRAGGKAVLLLASLLTGALLALVGQTYQTGADPWELFAVWAVAILPWVVLGRFGALWLLWLVLVNLAAYLHFRTLGGLFGWLFDTEQRIWAVFAVNTAALLAWELAGRSGAAWLRERWPVRIVAAASGGAVTTLAVLAILDFRHGGSGWAMLAWCAWMTAAFFYYRSRQQDLFILAGGVLAAIVVATTFLARHVLRNFDAGGFLFIGLVVIGMSAAGGMWLKSVASEVEK
ncbi:DUF2157 domain-containing protein [Janthinobacterium sp. 17J80-10]|uniref:DUF2157 domain-containing protein n=1 Tax=Janthinobacterium sp. 17J80-10 TaxID=2497863 RepID=UPI0010057F4C|nr:DUF2157 domain-containing protein [Janthinobacterium sp. 17J80-10]QAU33560.1 DUF2157 domain-containing protein [Janthinobacterium sp. 17J80-10]